jgi:hypothetical protein
MPGSNARSGCREADAIHGPTSHEPTFRFEHAGRRSDSQSLKCAAATKGKSPVSLQMIMGTYRPLPTCALK